MQTGVKAPANYTVADAVNDWLERGLKGRDENPAAGKRDAADRLERVSLLDRHQVSLPVKFPANS